MRCIAFNVCMCIVYGTFQIRWKKMAKRLFDIICASIGLLVFIIPMTFIAFVIWIKMGRPVLFTQIRPGKGGRFFKIYKFRTMLSITDEQGQVLPDNQRITPFGQFLRSTSLDELPTLFNVLKGDMSFVGPRPLLVEYLPFYTNEQAQRHFLRPGITGWAQIKGRNAITWEEKFLLDIWYVNNHSLYLDIKIILLTIKKVLKREGISHGECATMPRFDDEMRRIHEK